MTGHFQSVLSKRHRAGLMRSQLSWQCPTSGTGADSSDSFCKQNLEKSGEPTADCWADCTQIWTEHKWTSRLFNSKKGADVYFNQLPISQRGCLMGSKSPFLYQKMLASIILGIKEQCEELEKAFAELDILIITTCLSQSWRGCYWQLWKCKHWGILEVLKGSDFLVLLKSLLRTLYILKNTVPILVYTFEQDTILYPCFWNT